MTLKELTPNQLIQLKIDWLDRHFTDGVSYEELAHADELVTMSDLEEEFGGTYFVEEDFFC